MPTTQQMIARAEELERRAQALRLAAAEMTEQAATNKAPLFAGALSQAVALRRQQRTSVNSNGNGHALDETSQNGAGGSHAAPGGAIDAAGDREAIVRAALAEGPQTALQLRAALAQHGEEVSPTWITQGVLRPMADVRKIGTGSLTRWALRTPRGPKAPPTTTKKSYSGSALREKRARTAAALEQFGASGATFTPAELRGQGVPDEQIRMLAALTRYGYLKHKGEGYVRTGKVFTP